MADIFQYRISKTQKEEIAQNLIDFLENVVELKDESITFITNWLYTGPDEKRKAFFDVWEIVLKNYLPTSRPILLRSCNRRSKNGKIASFTGRMEFVRRYTHGKGLILICDTKDTILDGFERGDYRRSFFPIVDLLKKAKTRGGCGFSEHTFQFIGEDEYIMKIDLDNMYGFKWLKHD